MTTLLAFFVGGLVVLATGHDPISTYKGIFNGTGLNWFFPWLSEDDRILAEFNLQQTLLLTATLMLTGLAVAFAFRCGMFNIGGQGQYIVGTIVATWIGVSFVELNSFVHIALVIVLASLAGAVWAGIAGFLKATVGAHEVISTIMLNWIAIWVGSYLFGQGGPLQNTFDASVPISDDIAEGAKLPGLVGRERPAGPPHRLLHRDRRARRLLAHPQPHDARLPGARGRLQPGGGPLRRHQRGPELLRRDGDLGTLRRPRRRDRHPRLAVPARRPRHPALDRRLHRHRGGAARSQHARSESRSPSLLFGALLYGTSTRSLDPEVFQPELAGNLTQMIQGLVLLFVGADVLVIFVWRRIRRKRQSESSAGRSTQAPGTERSTAESDSPTPRTVAIAGIAIGARRVRGRAAAAHRTEPLAWPILIGLLGIFAGVWAATRGQRKLGMGRCGGRDPRRRARPCSRRARASRTSRRSFTGGLLLATLRFATPLTFAAIGGMFSERSGVVNIGLEGMMLTGAFFGIVGAREERLVGRRGARGDARRRSPRGNPRVLLHPRPHRSDRQRHGDQLPSARRHRLLLHPDLRRPGDPGDISRIPEIGGLNLMIWLSFLLVIASYVVMFRTPFGLRLRAVGEHPRAADTVGISVYGMRYVGVIVSGMLAALGGAYLSIGFLGSFTENMIAGRGFIALAALIFGNWRPLGAFGAALLFGFSTALAYQLDVYSESARGPLPGAPVRADARRARRHHRPHQTACCGREAVRQAVTPW